MCKIGNKLVLQSRDVSPLTYTEATLIGHGLREDDIEKNICKLDWKKAWRKKRH